MNSPKKVLIIGQKKMKFNIREASENDTTFILQMIKELAAFENAPQEVITTAEQLAEDGFSDHPLFKALIIEAKDIQIGFCLYYYRYSTWKGKSLYLEDLYIQPEYRGNGIGKYMMRYLASIAVKEKCGRFEWQVLDWNEPAIKMYKQLGTDLDEEWINCRLEGNSIKKLALD